MAHTYAVLNAAYRFIPAVCVLLHTLPQVYPCVCCRLVHSSPLIGREPSTPAQSMLEESFSAIMDEVCGSAAQQMNRLG